MRISKLVTRTTNEASRSDVSRNAQLLTRAGYVDRLIAGVYSYLPLGLRVMKQPRQSSRRDVPRSAASRF
jgi:prolyl-tRNA synthetase